MQTFDIRKSERGPVIRREYEIHLDPWLRHSMRVADFTLLHEMVHLKLRYKDTGCSAHGHLFQREMKRLARIGAFNGLW
jgi:predicted SprT family Zn-dependent metalloprotease